MRIEIHTTNPTVLWEKIKKDINDKALETWDIVVAAKHEYLTHNPAQWKGKALLKPSTLSNPNRLIMSIFWYTNSEPTEYIKGLYVGRFTEVLLEHYRESFSKLETYA